MTTEPKLAQLENLDEDIEDGLTNANAPTALNPFATMTDLGGIGTPVARHRHDSLTVGTDTGHYTFSFASGSRLIMMFARGGGGSYGTAALSLDDNRYSSSGEATSHNNSAIPFNTYPIAASPLFSLSVTGGVWSIYITGISATALTYFVNGNNTAQCDILFVASS